MKNKIIIFIVSIIALFGCAQSNINNILLHSNYNIFNEVNGYNFRILILVDDNYQKVLLIAMDQNEKIIDYHEDVNNMKPFFPAYFINKNTFLIVIKSKLYIFREWDKDFQEIENIFSASVYVENDIIYTELAGPTLIGKSYNLKTLKHVREYKGFGSRNIKKILSSYSDGSGYLREASDSDKLIIIEKNKFLQIIHS